VETYEALARTLQSKNQAVAELGFQHLVGLSRGLIRFPPFNAAMSLEDRKAYASAIDDLIEKKQLPPRAPAKDKDKGAKDKGAKDKDR
jgi:hypothetical protein